MTAPNRTRHRTAAVAGAAAVLALGLTACSSSSSSSAPSSAQPTAASPTATSTGTGSCTADALLAVLPEGATMIRFDCEEVSGTQWAAAEVDPGPTVFFLQERGGTWDVSTSDEICGTASAGLPPALLDYCTESSPSSVSSPAAG